MITRTFFTLITLPLLLTACSKAPQLKDFENGATQGEIIETYGEPSTKSSMVKSHDAIFGPIETFWSTVPKGKTVEIWTYPAKGGMIELYFVEGVELRGKGFAPKGVVY